jgi:hypothetical protein
MVIANAQMKRQKRTSKPKQEQVRKKLSQELSSGLPRANRGADPSDGAHSPVPAHFSERSRPQGSRSDVPSGEDCLGQVASAVSYVMEHRKGSLAAAFEERAETAYEEVATVKSGAHEWEIWDRLDAACPTSSRLPSSVRGSRRPVKGYVGR